MLGTWAVSGDPQLSITVLEGLKNATGNNSNIHYAKGANISDDPEFAQKVNVFGTRIDIDERTPQAMINEALMLAKRSDVVVAVIGEASEMSGESSSRSSISLPDSQKKLIRALANTEKPLILVLMTGRPLALEEEIQLADAILLTWHPGIEAGNAIADVLFGKYNPSGKLTMTFPRNVGQVPIYYNHRTTGRPNSGDEFQKFRSNYLDVPNSPQFSFGYGLSYTTFAYSNIMLSKNSMNSNEKITATIKLTNTGKVDGEEVVQLYIYDKIRSITQPVKELKGFQKIFLKAGESKEVHFNIGINELAFYHHDMSFKAEAGEFLIYIGTNSDETISDVITLTE